MCEGEACFGVGQLVEVVEADHVGRLKMALWVLVAFTASPDFIVELGGGQGGQVGGVRRRDAHAIIWER